MTNYFRLYLGKANSNAAEALAGNFIGVDYNIHVDLTGKLPDTWQEFNKEFIPVYLDANPEKGNRAAGLACGAIWTVAKWLEAGDIVLSPDGQGSYMVGEVVGDYYYAPGEALFHRREVKWFSTIDKEKMSEQLQSSCASMSTGCDITKYQNELERLIYNQDVKLTTSDPEILDVKRFALESQLENFLVENWEATELCREYNIFIDEQNQIGKQYMTETGPLDILAISKDEKTFLVIELKKGRSDDAVVGQVQRYMGWVKENLATNGESVKGLIVTSEDSKKVRYALKVVPDVTFMTYEVNFTLNTVV